MDRFLKIASAVAGKRRSLSGLLLLMTVSLFSSSGCAALTFPGAQGVRVRHLSPELLAPSKDCEQTIPLTFLRQPTNKVYRLDAGDVLGVVVEGILGERNQPLPVQVSPPLQFNNLLAIQRQTAPPAIGYPVPVQDDGTLVLPSVAPLSVKGMTIAEAREAIRNLYLSKQLIQPENRIFVSLMQQRHYQVMVLRQEAATFGPSAEGTIATGKRGTGFVVDLPAYENDVLHALAQSGGLPGLDAYNEVVIYRDGFLDKKGQEDVLKMLQGKPLDNNFLRAAGLTGQTIRIPLRVPPGGKMPFGPEDIVLKTGDVVFLEAREDQWYFTGGLLPAGRFILPRDKDLDVIEAITTVHGPLFNGAFGGSNLSGDLVKPGIGNPSPVLLTVIRKTPGGGQVPIRVDLARAMKDPNERIRVQPGDVLIMQERPGDAFARYFSQTFLNFNVFWEVFRSSRAVGVLDASAPDRLPNRLGTGTVLVPQN